MKLGFGVVFAVVYTSCSAAPGGDGAEFVGSWVNMARAKDTLVIEQSGGAYVFKETSPSIFDGKMHTNSFPARLQDGKLLVTVGANVAHFSMEKTSGHLVGVGRAPVKWAASTPPCATLARPPCPMVSL